MKKLLLFSIVFVLMLFSQVQAASVDTVKAAIVKHSIEMGVDPAITLSIAKTESGYKQNLRSHHGAVGVFQLMPSTARKMGLNPYSLDDNIKGGIIYYKNMYKMFGSMEKAIAAYNAGPTVVKRYNAVPPYKETKRFVSKIMSDYYYLKAHTDPAVIAYQKSLEQTKVAQQQKQQAQKVAQAPKKETPKQEVAVVVKQEHAKKQELPKKVEVPIMAQIPETTMKGLNSSKAPVPMGSISEAIWKSQITDLNEDMKEYSIQM